MNIDLNLSFAIEQILRPIVVNAVEHAIDEVKKSSPPPAVAPDPDRFLTKKQVAEIFSVTEVSVWDWERKGFLTGYRIGNLVRYKYSEVMASPKMISRKGGSHA
jgi:hypothetical protein